MRNKPKLTLIRKKQILDKLWHINAYAYLNRVNRLALHEIIKDMMNR